MAHRWPGNVRELENAIERLVLLGRSAEVGVTELPKELPAPNEGGEVPFDGPVVPLDEIERRYARWAIAQLGGRKMLTAEKLGIDRKTLARLLDDSSDDKST
jgi:DNA-binding NtrC family response regulator